MTRTPALRSTPALLVGIGLFAALAGRPATASGQTAYSYQKLQVPGAAYTDATGIDGSGHVIGTYRDQNGDWHGYVFDGLGYTTIEYPGALETYLLGVGPQGQLLGSYSMSRGAEYHAFTLQDGVFTGFDYPNSDSDARDANASGQLVGVYNTGVSTPAHGFVKSGETYTSIDFPGAQATTAEGITNDGRISGSYRDAAGLQHGFLYSNGTYSPINFPGATESGLHAGNEAGAVVGLQRQGTKFRGFVLKNASFRSLEVDFPGVTYTSASAIDETGRIVGLYASTDCPTGCGFLATPQSIVPPQCDQSFTMTYNPSVRTLTLTFTLRTASPATWSVILLAQGVPVTLWSVSLPALPTPTVEVPVSIPNVPKIGTVTGGSLLSTTAAGVVCADIATVNTGTP